MGIVNRDCKGSQFSLKAWRLTMILFLTKFIYGILMEVSLTPLNINRSS